jgi:hypothetical protein
LQQKPSFVFFAQPLHGLECFSFFVYVVGECCLQLPNRPPPVAAMAAAATGEQAACHISL